MSVISIACASSLPQQPISCCSVMDAEFVSTAFVTALQSILLRGTVTHVRRNKTGLCARSVCS